MTPLTAFTDLRLITDNSAAWHARRTLIAQSKRSLDLCYFIVETDASSTTLMLDLIAAANRGVKVRVLVDYLLTYPHAPLLRALPHGNASIEVRRYGAPAAPWLAALRSFDVDCESFVEGLATQNTSLLLDSIKAATALPRSIVATLRNSLARCEQGAQAFALRVLGIFEEGRRKLRDLLHTAVSDQGRADPSVPGLLERLKAKVDEVRRGIAAIVEIVRGLEAFLHRTHHKLLMADATTFIMGGRNLADAYQCDAPAAGRPFRDVDLWGVDPRGPDGTHAVAFESLWHHASSEALLDPAALDAAGPTLAPEAIETLARELDGLALVDAANSTRTLPDSDGYIVNNLPGKAGDASITHAYIERIRSLTETAPGATIDIVSAYAYFQDQASASPSLFELRNSLAAAARAGLNVNVYTNSIDSTDLKSVNAAAYRTFADLIDSGVHVFELAEGHGSLHAKVAAIGDEWLMVGSFNMDPRSELYDTNNLIVLRDAAGLATSALRSSFIQRLGWTPLSADEARLLAESGKRPMGKFVPPGRLL